VARVARTFSSRLTGGFAFTASLTVVMGVAAVAGVTMVVNSKNRVIASASRQSSISQRLSTAVEQRIGDYRTYLITGSPQDLTVVAADRDLFLAQAAQLHRLFTDPVKLSLLDSVAEAEKAYTRALDRATERRKSLTKVPEIAQLRAAQVTPARQALQQAIARLIAQVEVDLGTATKASSRTAGTVVTLICLLAGLTLASAVLISMRLNRRLSREVGSAVGHIQNSATHLEAAAAQQVAGGKDQASAMAEITATISELLITSRQIADNAQRVSSIAEEATAAAHRGDATIEQTRSSINAIRAQVDNIVRHMLALGEKSQQIGGIAGLVSELAEQTNILAVNATIEAAGAGEQGRRFTVVAEEIRKLADRTAGSAKEIRALIDDVRGAVGTTVTATEAGAAAVDTGVAQFDSATTAFRHIAELVTTAHDAGREIELSTQQQTSAVEQVNASAADTARITRDTEAGAVQTKQTAAQLSTLSDGLRVLVGAAPK
jgi:methyl-accepting chemotaxis protein